MGRRRRLTDTLLEQAGHEYSSGTRLIALLFLAPVFLFALPWLFIQLGERVDTWMQWPPVAPPPLNVIAGFLLILPSSLLGLWANHSQFTIGRGTPVPLMATQALIVGPPYTYSRNPMALGAIGMYLGVALLFHSLGSVIVVATFAAVLLTYIKRAEEQEMAARFGQEYLAYKQRTPFLLPRIWNRR